MHAIVHTLIASGLHHCGLALFLLGVSQHCAVAGFKEHICPAPVDSAPEQPWSPSQRMELQYQDEAPILIPKELIFEKLDKTWLQIKATSQPMIHFISGNRSGKNSSLVSSTTLQKMLKDRHAKIDQAADKEPAQNLFEGEPQSPKRKIRRRATMDPSIVTIQVQNRDIHCLVAEQRAKSSDLVIELDASQIQAIVQEFRAEDLQTSMAKAKRSYQKKDRA